MTKQQAGVGGRTYFSYMKELLKKSAADIRPFIVERTLAFGRPWYAKKVADKRGWTGSEGWTKEGILENAMAEFDEKHKLNEDRVGEENRLVSLVDNLLDLLAEIMP